MTLACAKPFKMQRAPPSVARFVGTGPQPQLLYPRARTVLQHKLTHEGMFRGLGMTPFL